LLSRELSLEDQEISTEVFMAGTQVLTPFGSATVLDFVAVEGSTEHYVLEYKQGLAGTGYVHRSMVMPAVPSALQDLLPPDLQSQVSSWVSPRQIASSIPKMQAGMSKFFSDDAMLVKVQKQLFQRG
jgi:hypothetical protein